jgi:carbon storage regulator CsrA
METHMLVLTRHVGQVIVIGERIEVHVAGIDRRHVRLAIKAPRSTKIVRAELQMPDSTEQSSEVVGPMEVPGL